MCVSVRLAVCMTNGLAVGALAKGVSVCVSAWGRVRVLCGQACKLFATMSKSNNAGNIAACMPSIKFPESVLKFFKVRAINSQLADARHAKSRPQHTIQ